MRAGKKSLILVVITATIFLLIIFLVVQQTLRLSANQPQRSMAASAAQRLQSGASPSETAPGYIDIALDAAPFTIIYDQYGKVVAGNGYINNQVPQVPIGVLNASKGGVHTAVWEPAGSTRVASASVSSGDRYVLVGRSLQATENQIRRAGFGIAAVWIVLLVLVFGGYRLVNHRTKKDKGGNSENTAATA